MFSIQRSCVLTVIALAFSIPYANESDGGLIMHVDAVNNELYFSGTDTGTYGALLSFAEVRWEVGTGGTANFGDAGFDFIGPTPLSSLSGLELNASGHLFVRALTFNSGHVGQSLTITGNGTRYSYHPVYESTVEPLIGTSLPLVRGSGYDPIQIIDANAGTVPEPSTMAIWSLLGFAGLAARRRRRAAQDGGHE